MIYLLLFNKLPQNLVTQNVNIYYFTVSVGQEFGSRLLIGWFWLRVFHMLKLARVAVIWRLDMGWWIPFQDGSLTELARWCWLLARGLSSSPSRTSSQNCLNILLTRQLASHRVTYMREWGKSCKVCFHLVLKPTIFLVLFSVMETIVGHEYRKLNIIWATLETSYHIVFH